MIHGMPRPAPDFDSAPFWEGCERDEFLIPECAACGKRRWPPGPMCPYCQSMETRWTPASGRGSLYSWVVVEHPTHPVLVDQVPYVVGLIELPEGVRVVGNVCETPISDVRAEMTLELFFEAHNGLRLPNFRRAR